VKEVFEGRRLGFAPRSHLAFVAIGLAFAVTVLDLMAWFSWGVRETNSLVVAAQWLAIATFLVVGAAALTALAEFSDVPAEERGLARIDQLAAIGALLLYAVTVLWRSTELGASAASPVPFLVAIAGMILLVADAGLAANLYSAREWEELEEEPARERHPRRRAAGR
jgi:hypothetical protein